jgi:organic hydroperoxide reductase OsmC/OhrA
MDVSHHTARVTWERAGSTFVDNRYSRVHSWTFDGGAEVVASSSPAVIPLPMSSAEAVDPEEAFVASLSSCHMLWFLAVAANKGFVVDQYVDDAKGTIASASGKKRFVEVVLRPRVEFCEPQIPTVAEVHALHEKAHAECYLANSVAFEVRCEPQP